MERLVNIPCLIIIFLNTMVMNNVSSLQYFLTQPENTTAMVGSLVTLPCMVANMQGVCQWTRDGLGLGVDQELAAYPRFTMSENSCALQIAPLLPSDEGVYQCQVGAMPGVAPITSQSANLRVTSEPGQPHITQATLGDVMEVKVGEKVLLECQSLGGKPAAEIEWSDENGKLIEDGVVKKVVLMEDGKTYRSISSLKFSPTSDTNVTCSAKSDVLPKPKTSLIVIKHLKKPEVYLNLENPRIQAGDSFDITCSTEAYPVVVDYTWYINGQLVFNEESSVLRIKKISKHFNKVEVKCRAANKVGSDESSLTLNVEYAPMIINEPDDILAKTGDSVTFKCLAEANPPPTYVWIKMNSKEVVGFSANLTVEASETAEMFVCKVFSEGFEDIECSPARLRVIKSPKIQAIDEGQVGGEPLLHCSVVSVARKTKITWIANDGPINMEDKDYEIIYNEDGVFHHSFLVLKNEEKRMVEHACFASNEVGTDYKVAQLGSNHSNYTTIIIVVFLLTIIIILLSFALFFHQRQVRSSVDRMEKEKQDQIPATETEPCLDVSIMNKEFIMDESFSSPNHSFDSCNTLNTTLARSFSLDLSRTERRMGV
eukprot:GFUD01035622.1.p1 GENE.GFUD01035622.1~~GFUD01035622.1.p1  ORF type:complete len:599 (-),score=139.25 GFUD01035622.1:150-1946(-)